MAAGDRFLGGKGQVPGETPLSSQGQPEAPRPGCQFWVKSEIQRENLLDAFQPIKWCFFQACPWTNQHTLPPVYGPINMYFILSPYLPVDRSYPLPVSSLLRAVWSAVLCLAHPPVVCLTSWTWDKNLEPAEWGEQKELSYFPGQLAKLQVGAKVAVTGSWLAC